MSVSHRSRIRLKASLIPALVISGLVLAACSGARPNAAVHHHSTDSTSTTGVPGSSTTAPRESSTTAPQATTTTVAPTTTTTVPFAVSQVQSGTGPASLAKFSVPGKDKEWDIDWVFSCNQTPTKTGSFKISVVGYGAASHTADAGVTETGAGTAGISQNHDKGTFSLNIATACKWTVRVETFTSIPPAQ